jgi:WD40 repeat protein
MQAGLSSSVQFGEPGGTCRALAKPRWLEISYSAGTSFGSDSPHSDFTLEDSDFAGPRRFGGLLPSFNLRVGWHVCMAGAMDVILEDVEYIDVASHDVGLISNLPTCITVDIDGKVMMWNIETGECMKKFVTRKMANSVDVFGDLILIAGCNVRSINCRTSERRRLKPEIDGIVCARWSPTGESYLMVGHSRKAWLKSRDGRTLVKYKGHTQRVLSCAFAPDGVTVLTGSEDNSARLWSCESGKCVRVYHSHACAVRGVAFAPDGATIATACKFCHIWKVPTDSAAPLLAFQVDDVSAWALEFSPNGLTVVTCTDWSAKIWSARTGELLMELSGHTDYVLQAIFSPDGNGVLTVSADESAKFWSVESGRCLRTLTGHLEHVTSAAWSTVATCAEGLCTHLAP